MNKKIIVYLSMMFFMFYITCNVVEAMKPATGDYVISSLKMTADVKESGIMMVQETIDITNCEDKQFKRPLLTSHLIDVNKDGNLQTVNYIISDIQVEGHNFNIEKTEELNQIVIDLPDEKDTIKIRYNVRLKDFHLTERQLFYYTMIPPYFEGPIQFTEISINMPKKFQSAIEFIDSTNTISNVLLSQQSDNTMRLTSTRSIKALEGISVRFDLPSFYFTYEEPLNTPLIAVIISILLVSFSYIRWYIKEKKFEKDISFSPYPFDNIPLVMIGYIRDGEIKEDDFFPLIIEWAKQGYIQIVEQGQTVSLYIRKELPSGLFEYEYILFNAIFGNYDMVTIDELMRKNMNVAFQNCKEIVYEQILDEPIHHVYHSSSFLHQLYCCLMSALPFLCMSFATYYLQNYDVLNSILMSSLYFVATTISFIPIILAFYYQRHMNEQIKRSVFIGCTIFGLVILLFLSYQLFMLKTSLIYIFINFIMTIAYAGNLLLIERRTLLGNQLWKQVSSLSNFIHHARRNQLEQLIHDHPQYFAMLLPYAYAMELDDIWYSKFKAMVIQKPYWFKTTPRTYSTMYWLEPLDYALEDIFYAMTYQMNKDKETR